MSMRNLRRQFGKRLVEAAYKSPTLLDVVTNGVKPVIAAAERAVLTPRRGGGFEVRLEKGSVQFY